MSAIRKQLQWDENVDVWPITDASAVHYTYDPSDASRISSPVLGTSYGLDKFLNGLGDIFMTRDEVAAIATNISKGPGVLYNSNTNTTAVAVPAVGDTAKFVKCTYGSNGTVSISFDANSYLTTSTLYAAGESVGGIATKAKAMNGGAKGNVLYQSAANTTAFLANPSSSSYVLGFNATSGIPQWVVTENNTTTTGATNKSFSLRSDSWLTVATDNTSVTLPTTAGMYAVYIDNTNGSYAGVFAVKGASNKLEEIPLHWSTNASNTADSNRIYAATLSGKLVLASTNSSATSYTLTIKFKQII